MDETASDFHCPVCGSVNAEMVMELPHRSGPSPTGGEKVGDVRFALVRCTSCSLLRLHPLPDEVMLAAAYAEGYAPHSRTGISGRGKSWLERRSVRQLQHYLAPPRRVLDVGCATGELLQAIREAGNPNVIGVELGEGAAGVARERGLDVHTGTLEDARLPDCGVDTIIASHTLEHVPEPVGTLREMFRILRPGGAIILWLPNAQSIEARVLGRRWIGYDPPRHLTTFGVSTLGRALMEAGFRTVEVRHEAVGLEWAWGFRHWLRERRPALERAIAPMHPLLIVAATPLAAIGALVGRSGRIRVIAVKPVD